ncbi:MAG: hypothetical protein FWE23_10290 [Chitinivibrionia bacterium]|nr:hypothetical protein [Chitinivibrionia bacterium]
MDWEEVKKNVQKGAEIAAEKVSQYSRIAKLKMDQLILKRRVEKNYISAGLRAYEYVKDSKEEAIPASLIDEFVQEIDKSVAEIEDLDREIEKIKEEAKKDKDDAAGEVK